VNNGLLTISRMISSFSVAVFSKTKLLACFFGSRAAGVSDPYCVSATLMLNISETGRFRRSCPIGTLQESAHCVSIGDVIDDVT